jgi:Type II restriction endonuclease EcoO109I
MSTGEPVDEQESSSNQSSSAEEVDELRTDLTAKIAALLKVDDDKARKIVESFDAHVARPVEKKFAELQPHDLTKRNPYFYAVLGITSVEDWVDRALADRETSALEGHVGTWLEDVARIMSGGFKPASGVDVQRDVDDNTVELYSLQMAGNTKNRGGSQQEIANLRQAAAALRAHQKRVTTIVGVMHGRKSSASPKAAPDVLKPSSKELWEMLTGQQDFLPRLAAAARLLSVLVSARAHDEAERLKLDAVRTFAAEDGTLDLGKLIEPPPRPRRRTN